MGLFDFLKTDEKPRNIWDTKDKEELVTDIWNLIDEKCDYGDNMQALNEQERIFYITQQVEMEVDGSGFYQFFYNSYGKFANEMVGAFEEIFAYHTARICQKAIDAFGAEIPVDEEAREELMDELKWADEDVCRFTEILEECDEAFCEYKEDLTKLNYEYLMRNRSFFEV